MRAVTEIHAKQGHPAQKWRGQGRHVLRLGRTYSQAGNGAQDKGKSEVRNCMV